MRLVSLLLMLMLSLPALAQKTNYGIPAIQNYGPKQHGAGLQNWGIAQDEDGLMYFANQSGVLTFDGHHWNTIPLSNNRTARSLAWSSKEKRMYVGGQGDLGYVGSDSLGRHSFVSLLDSLPERYHRFLGDVWSAETTDAGAFFLSRDYFLHYSRGTFKVSEYKFPPEGGYGFYLMWKVKETLYVQSPDKGLYLYRKDSLIQPDYGKQVVVFRNGALGYLPWGDDEVLLIQDDGSTTIFGENGPLPGSDPKLSRLREYLVNRPAYKAITVPGFGYAFVTHSDGLLITDESFNLKYLLNKDAGMFDNAARSAFHDKAGNLWVTTNAGITHVLLNSPLTFASENQGVDRNVLTSLYKGDTLYLGTSWGVKYATIGKFRQLEGTTGTIWDLDNINGQLYISNEGKVFRLKPDKTTEELISYSIWGLEMLKTRPNTAILKAYNAPLKSFELVNGKLVKPKSIVGYFGDARHLTEDAQGQLWVGNGYDTIRSLSLNATRDTVRVRKFTASNGLINTSGNDIISFNNAGRQEVLINSGNSFFTYDQARDTFLVYQPLEGVLTGTKYSIFEQSPSGDIYLRSGDLLARLSPSAGTYEADTIDFKKINEMSIQKIVALPDSTVLFMGQEGLVQYHPDARLEIRTPFKTRIDQVNTPEGIFYGGTSISEAFAKNNNGLEYSNNSITFSYSALSYDEPEKNIYSYQLDGYDSEWSGWTTANYKEYTNLREGLYTFRVRSKNGYGIPGEEGSFRFTVFPPWYRSSLAIVGYAILVLAIIWSIVRAYTYRLIKEKERLEVLVEERTQEISRQKDELKEANDRLIELDQFKEEMTAMIVHDLKNPLGVIIRRGERKVASLARKMLNLVLNLIDVQRFEEASLRLSLADIAFTKVLNQALEQVKDGIEEKNMKLEVVQEESLRLRLDEALIERVLINLLSNAVKYAPASTVLTITIEKKGESNLYFSLKDEGPGIPEHMHTAVFDRYVRGASEDQQRMKSSGLGLTFCRLAIEAHGGEIGVESVEGAGATFWFILPDAVDTEAGPKAEIPELNLSLNNEERVLLASIIDQLGNLQVHQSTIIESLIESLGAPEGTALYQVGQQLIDAAYNGDEDRYHELLREHGKS